jgi:hypothetical protein
MDRGPKFLTAPIRRADGTAAAACLGSSSVGSSSSAAKRYPAAPQWAQAFKPHLLLPWLNPFSSWRNGNSRADRRRSDSIFQSCWRAAAISAATRLCSSSVSTRLMARISDRPLSKAHSSGALLRKITPANDGVGAGLFRSRRDAARPEDRHHAFDPICPHETTNFFSRAFIPTWPAAALASHLITLQKSWARHSPSAPSTRVGRAS